VIFMARPLTVASIERTFMKPLWVIPPHASCLTLQRPHAISLVAHVSVGNDAHVWSFGSRRRLGLGRTIVTPVKLVGVPETRNVFRSRRERPCFEIRVLKGIDRVDSGFPVEL
jgi:hypothetical protein